MKNEIENSNENLEVLAPLPAIRIKAYERHQQAAVAVVDKYRHLPDPTTKDGYDNLSAGIKAAKAVRVDLEKVRKAEKKESLEIGRAIDNEARHIRLLLESVEKPMREAKEYFDTRKEREQRDKLASVFAAISHNSGSESIQAAIDAVSSIHVDEYPDIISEAMTLKKDRLNQLNESLALAVASEKAKAEEAERKAKHEADKKALEERQEAQRKIEAEHEQKRLKAKAELEAKADALRKEQAEIESKRKAEAEEAAKRLAEQSKREQKAKAELEAKTDKEAVQKMRIRLGEVDWSKPSAKQIKAVWLELKNSK